MDVTYVRLNVTKLLMLLCFYIHGSHERCIDNQAKIPELVNRMPDVPENSIAASGPFVNKEHRSNLQRITTKEICILRNISNYDNQLTSKVRLEESFIFTSIV